VILKIGVPDRNIDAALEYPHSLYWARDLVWDTKTRKGSVVERESVSGSGRLLRFGEHEIEKGLRLMADAGAREFHPVIFGSTDGPARDVFLQYVVFGKVVYG